MEYIRITSPNLVENAIVDKLISHLQDNERVLWLLSGGSAIDLEVTVSERLRASDTSLLSIMLMDERYGPLGHEEENYAKLIEAGFCLPLKRILDGASPESTAAGFAAQLDSALNEAAFTLGLFGMGIDGHTAGIKPQSPAVNSQDVAVYYPWDDYKRITMTPMAVARLDEAILYATGESKKPSLMSLLHDTLPVNDQPVQVLKSIKAATLYTDVTL